MTRRPTTAPPPDTCSPIYEPHADTIRSIIDRYPGRPLEVDYPGLQSNLPGARPRRVQLLPYVAYAPAPITRDADVEVGFYLWHVAGDPLGTYVAGPAHLYITPASPADTTGGGQ